MTCLKNTVLADAFTPVPCEAKPITDVKTKRIIRQKEVCNKLGLSKATVWLYVRTRNDFPKPFRLGANSVGWLESDIDAWIDARVAERG